MASSSLLQGNQMPYLLPSIVCEINLNELWPTLSENIRVEVILDTGATIPMPLSRVLNESNSNSEIYEGVENYS